MKRELELKPFEIGALLVAATITLDNKQLWEPSPEPTFEQDLKNALSKLREFVGIDG